jgi:hypothetical protein
MQWLLQWQITNNFAVSGNAALDLKLQNISVLKYYFPDSSNQ